jgi:protein-disulfide isomerase
VPSGKKSREQRRAAAVRTPPPVRSTGGRGRQASPRALAIAGGIVAVVAVVIVLAVTLGGGKGGGLPKNHAAVGSLANGLPGAADVAAEFKGVPQRGTTLGSPFAPVTLTEYIDLQCPVCRDFETTVFPDLVRKYVRTGKVKVVVKPWAFISNDSYRGQNVMLAAAKQNKAFNFAALLYDNQGQEQSGWLTDQMIYNIAAGVPGLKIDPLFAERNSSTVKKEASQVAADALASKVNATPAIFVNKSSAAPKLFIEGMPDETKLFAALDAAAS